MSSIIAQLRQMFEPYVLGNLHCERISSNTDFEPLNVVTNVAFFISAWYSWWLLSKRKAGRLLFVLPALIVLIGLGSIAFHSTPTAFTYAMDKYSIILFTSLSIYILLRVLVGRFFTVILLVAGFFAAEVAWWNFEAWWKPNHLLTILVVLGLYFWTKRKFSFASRTLKQVLALYFLGNVVAIAEIPLCPIFPLGTHFIWHVFVAWVTYLAVKFLVILRQRS